MMWERPCQEFLRVSRSRQGPATEQSVQLPFEVPADRGYASDHTHHYLPRPSNADEPTQKDSKQ